MTTQREGSIFTRRQGVQFQPSLTQAPILTLSGVIPVVHAQGQLIDNPDPCPTLGVLNNLAGDLHRQIVPASPAAPEV